MNIHEYVRPTTSDNFRLGYNFNHFIQQQQFSGTTKMNILDRSPANHSCIVITEYRSFNGEIHCWLQKLN